MMTAPRVSDVPGERALWSRRLAHNAELSVLGIALVLVELDFATLGLTNTNGPDWVRWLLVLLFVVLPSAWAAFTSPDLTRLLQVPAARPLAVLLGWFGVTLLWSADRTNGVVVWALMVSTALMGALWTMRFGFDSVSKTCVRFGGLFLALSIAFGAMGTEDRWHGLSDSPTSLARLAAFVAALALCQYHRGGAALPTVAVLGLAAVVLIGSQTRTHAALLVVLSALVVVKRARASDRVLVASAVFGCALFAAGLLSSTLLDFATRGDEVDNLSEFNGRSAVWPTALELIEQRPLLGHGVGAGSVVWAQASLDGAVHFHAFHSHQILLELLLIGGIVSFSLFSVFVVSVSRARWSSDPFVNRLLLFSLLATGLTEAQIETESVVFVTLGVMAVAGHQRRLA